MVWYRPPRPREATTAGHRRTETDHNSDQIKKENDKEPQTPPDPNQNDRTTRRQQITFRRGARARFITGARPGHPLRDGPPPSHPPPLSYAPDRRDRPSATRRFIVIAASPRPNDIRRCMSNLLPSIRLQDQKRTTAFPLEQLRCQGGKDLPRSLQGDCFQRLERQAPERRRNERVNRKPTSDPSLGHRRDQGQILIRNGIFEGSKWGSRLGPRLPHRVFRRGSGRDQEGISPPTTRLSTAPDGKRVPLSAWLMMARVRRSTVDG